MLGLDLLPEDSRLSDIRLSGNMSDEVQILKINWQRVSPYPWWTFRSSKIVKT